jgi:hypothetical protein
VKELNEAPGHASQSYKMSSRREPERSSPHPLVTRRNPVRYILHVVYLGSMMKVGSRNTRWPCAAMAIAMWEACAATVG